MEIFIEGDFVLFKKYNAQKTCMITGEVLKENKEYASGIVLSPKGVEILLQKLEVENPNNEKKGLAV